MKFHLSIHPHPNVSYACEGVTDFPVTHPSGAAWEVRLSNRAIAGMIRTTLPCQIRLPDAREFNGEIQPQIGNNRFVVHAVNLGRKP